MLGEATERHARWVGTPVELIVRDTLEDAPGQTHLPIELGKQRVNQRHPLILQLRRDRRSSFERQLAEALGES